MFTECSLSVHTEKLCKKWMGCALRMDTPLRMRFALEIFVEYAFRVPSFSTRPQSLSWFALLCASLVLYTVGYNDLFRFRLVF